MKIIDRIKKMSIAKKVLLLLGVMISVLVLWQVGKVVLRGSGGGGFRQASVAVEVKPVETGLIRDLGQFSGTLIPKSQFVVAPKVSGKLKKLYVNIGDRVTKGQIVAQLDDEEYQQQVAQADADLRVARANSEEAKSALELARKDLERAETLHQKGILSDSQFDTTRAQFQAQEARFKVAEAQVTNREAALETARVRLSYTRIFATWESGGNVRYVGERFVDEGALLSVSTPIISIVEIQPITAVIYATDKEYFRIQTGQQVSVALSVFTDKRFQGEVVRVAPLLKETSRQARVEIDIDNEEGLLKPGMFVNVEIEFARRQNARMVPFSSLVYRNNLQGVFLADLENRKVSFRPVKVGIIEGERAEVVEPEDISGYVVVLGQHLLQDEMNIVLPESGSATGKKPDSTQKAGKPSGPR
jgi:RND family efflux transporter MFP subunit